MTHDQGGTPDGTLPAARQPSGWFPVRHEDAGDPLAGDVLGRVGGVDLTVAQSVVRVTEIGSISAAAVTLGCSQPGLSQRIRAAERTLGSRLFDRHPQGVLLTDFGAAVLPFTRVLLIVGQAMAEEVARTRPGPAGPHR
jgi:hypothetical protein